MDNTRKRVWNILNDNLINLFNLAIIVLLIILIINGFAIFIIPLVPALLASFFNLFLDIKYYNHIKKEDKIVHVITNGIQSEKSSLKLRVGDQVLVYPKDETTYTGKVIKGVVFVSESKINGNTKLIKKGEGEYIKYGSVIASGTATVEITNVSTRKNDDLFSYKNKTAKYFKYFEETFALITLVIILLNVIFSRDSLSFQSTYLAAIAALPGVFNFMLALALYLDSRKLAKQNIIIQDQISLETLNDIDVVCFDKTGTLTTGEFEIFKSVALNTEYGSSMGVNRTFDQVVSDIIKANNEVGGFYTAINKVFTYDLSKIVESHSSSRENGLYSVATFRGGKTFAIGEVENFEYINEENVNKTVNEYRTLGYQVLIVVEAKNPIKNGLIDGKTTGIGVIVFKEIIRPTMPNLISELLQNNKVVKVISGDNLASVSDAASKVGLDIVNKAISLEGLSFEQLDLLIEDYCVFADASVSQKKYIITKLREHKHNIMFIGDGDNDTQALKASDFAVSLSSGTVSAKRCSHAVIDSSLDSFKDLNVMAKRQKGKILNSMSIAFSQAAFSCFYLVVFFFICLFQDNLVQPIVHGGDVVMKISLYNPFMYPYLLMWSIFGVYAGIGIILFDRTDRRYVTNSFIRIFVGDSLLLIVGAGAMYILYLLQYNSIAFFSLPSDRDAYHNILFTSHVTDNLTYLLLMMVSGVILFKHLTPFNKYRIIAFASVCVIPLVYIILLAFSVDAVGVVTQIYTQNLTFANYFTPLVVLLITSSIYLLVLNIIEAVKGESIDVESKSRS